MKIAELPQVPLLLAILAALTLVGCASGNCRQVESLKGGAPAAAAGDVVAVPGGSEVKSANQNSKPQSASNTAEKTVTVYKYDGSLQCAMGKALSVEEMEKQLKGIRVLERGKKPDGLMHIQVCGAPTGMVNYYVIPEKNLPEAQKSGFKKWDLE